MNRKFMSFALSLCLAIPQIQIIQMAAQEPGESDAQPQSEGFNENIPSQELETPEPVQDQEDSLANDDLITGEQDIESNPEEELQESIPKMEEDNDAAFSLETLIMSKVAPLFETAVASDDPEEEYHTFTITSTPGGTVEPAGEVKVPLGYGIGIKFKSDEGYYLADYYVNGKLNSHSLPYANPYSLTYHEVDKDYTVHAVFKKKDPAQFTIQAVSSQGGKITPSGAVEVTENEDQTFEFAPDSGYFLKDVLVDGESKGADLSKYTFEYITQNHKIEAIFEKTELTIVSSCNEGGSISPEGTETVLNGQNKSYQITPSQGYVIKDVKVDGESKGALTEYTFESVADDHTIEAEFEKIEYTITASSQNGGTISPEGDVKVKYNENQTFEITPDQGYTVKDVKVDGESKGSLTSYTFETVKDNHSIEAEFEKVEYIIKASCNDGGTLSPKGDVQVEDGKNQIFEITPDQGYKVKDVKVDGESKGAGLSKFVFEAVTADHTIEVEFAKAEYTISASCTTGGQISPKGDVTVLDGSDQKFEITPEDGYEISDVKVDGISQGKINSYTFGKVAANHTISASFAKKTTTTVVNTSSTTPNTGDRTNAVLWISLAAAAFAGLISMKLAFRKEEF